MKDSDEINLEDWLFFVFTLKTSEALEVGDCLLVEVPGALDMSYVTEERRDEEAGIAIVGHNDGTKQYLKVTALKSFEQNAEIEGGAGLKISKSIEVTENEIEIPFATTEDTTKSYKLKINDLPGSQIEKVALSPDGETNTIDWTIVINKNLAAIKVRSIKYYYI